MDFWHGPSNGWKYSAGSAAVRNTEAVVNERPENPSAAQPPPASGRSRGRKRVARFVIVLALLLLIVAIVGQIILSSSIPRSIILSRLQQELGLRVNARTVRTTWWGRTALNEVTIALPLGKSPFLSVPQLKVRNSNVIWLMLGRKLRIYSLDFYGPDLTVTQRSDGRWNLQDLVEVVSRGNSQKSADASPIPLPDLHVERASVAVTDQFGHATTIKPLDLDGYADSAVSWKYEAHVPARLDFSGRLAPGGSWEHEATVRLQNIAEWVHPFYPGFPSDAAVDADWHGLIRNSALSGNFDLKQATAGGVRATGAIAATLQPGAALLIPGNLTVRTGEPLLGELKILSGRIAYDGHLASADRLEIAAYGGPVRLSGTYDRATQGGELHAAWENLGLPGNIRHGGKLDLTLHQPFPQRIVIDGALNSTGSAPAGPWQALADFHAQGSGWENFDWQAHASKLAWQRRRPVHLDGLQLTGTMRPPSDPHQPLRPTLSLDSVTRAGDEMSGRGAYDFAARTWLINLQGSRWPLHPIEGTELGYAIRAFGNSTLVHLQEFTLHAEQADVLAVGEYQLGVPRPLEVRVNFTNRPTPTMLDARLPYLSGSIVGSARLKGTLWPIQLELNGKLTGRDVRLGLRPLQNIDLVMTGRIDPDTVDVQTEKLKFLGGSWDLRGNYAFAEDAMNVSLAVADLSLAELGALANTSALSGSMDGRWNVYIPGVRPDLATLKLQGDATAKNVHAANLAADSIRIRTAMDGGVLSADPVQLARGIWSWHCAVHLGRTYATSTAGGAGAVGMAADAAGERAGGEHLVVG